MAKELDGIIDSSEAEFAKSCITSDGSTSYLEKIITPIYESMAAVGSFIEGSISDVLVLTGLLLDWDKYCLPTCICASFGLTWALQKFGMGFNTTMYTL